MKNILVATDFSEASVSAGKYAKSLASAFNARLHLYNVYQPVPTPAETLVSLSPSDFKEHSIQKLVDQARALEIYELPYCDTDCGEGEPVDEIIRKVKRENIDLVIAGMKMEHKGFRKVFGSTISSLFMRSPVPVLVVPESGMFKEIKTIALAFEEYVQEPIQPHLLDAFREIAERFHSSVYLVKVFGDELMHEMKFQHKPHYLMKMLRTLDPIFETIDGNDVVEELLQYIENRDIDILAALPHKLVWIERLFAKSVTKHLIFSTHIPLLIIPENKQHS